MTKLRKSEVFSLLQGDLLGGAHPPSQAALHFFRKLRPSLERQPWDGARSYSQHEFTNQEMDVDTGSFIGHMTWQVEGTDSLILADNPTDRGRVEEVLHVNSLEWRNYASIKLIRSVLDFSVVNLDSELAATRLNDSLFMDVELRAVSRDGSQNIQTAFSASSDRFPNGYRSENLRTPIRSTDRVERNDHTGQADDIAALRQSIQLMQAAIAYLREK